MFHFLIFHKKYSSFHRWGAGENAVDRPKEEDSSPIEEFVASASAGSTGVLGIRQRAE